MNLLEWFEKTTTKKWDPALVERYMGSVKEQFLSHSVEPSLRQFSASGGSVSAILDYLLETRQVDGALVNELYVESGIIKNRFVIAQDQDALLRSQGSKYLSVRFSTQAVSLIRSFNGRLAVVALPCDSSLLRSLCEKDEELNKKVFCLISLFCGHNSTPELTNNIVRQTTKNYGSELIRFHYRSGTWRGNMFFEFANGDTITKPFGNFGTLQNLFFFCEKKCLYCHDHFGYSGDISAGDIWIQSMQNREIKPTALLVRTEKGMEIIHSAAAVEKLSLEQSSKELIFRGQTRAAKCHYQVSARKIAGKLFNLRIPDELHEKFNLIDLLIGGIVILNFKFSSSPLGEKNNLSCAKNNMESLFVFL